MSAIEVAAVVVAAASVAGVVLLAVAVRSIGTALGAVQVGLDELRREVVPAVRDLARPAPPTTERVSAALEPTPRPAVSRVPPPVTHTGPVIKARALAAGAARAASTMRSRTVPPDGGSTAIARGR